MLVRSSGVQGRPSRTIRPSTASASHSAVSAGIGGRSDLLLVGPALRGGDLATVVRARSEAGAVIVKAFDPARDGEGWAREAAALDFLRGRGVAVPRLLAVAAGPPLIVCTDVGRGPNLAGALLGNDPTTATDALMSWGDAFAGLHRATAHGGPEFAAVLASYAGDMPADVDPSVARLAAAVATLADRLPSLGVHPDPDALDELRGIADVLGTDATALSPGDSCPDNTVSTPEGTVLVDLADAAVHHVAWDLAYLEVPWPSCWCSWRLPRDIADAAVTRWRDALAPTVPAVATHDFDGALDMARVAWAFMSTSWFLPNALGADPPPEDRRLHGVTPTRRPLIQHRLADAVERPAAGLPHLTALAESTLAATRRLWGTVPLAVAPAYASG